MNIFTYLSNVTDIMSLIGMVLLLGKVGVSKWWALVPGFGQYKLAQAVDREDEGRVYLGLYIAFDVLKLLTSLVKNSGSSMLYQLVSFFSLVAMLAVNSYKIRVFDGVCEAFGRKHKWLLAWVFAQDITLFIWGVGRKFNVVDHRNDKASVPASGSVSGSVYGSDGEFVMSDEGLSIDLKERTAGDMLKKHVLLKNIQMNIKPGHMVLLLGGSGAGKTTLLNAVTGYEKADARVLLDGVDVYENYERLKNKIGFVPQQDLIRYNDTVGNTVHDAAILKLPASVKGSEINEKVDSILQTFGLQPVRDRLVAKQSGGQKKRISIAMEFVSDPSLFILDEPDSGLDGVLARDLMRKLHEVSRMGKTVIVITHTPDRVLDMFDDVIILAKDADKTGRLVYFGPVDQAKTFFERDSMEAIVKSINGKEEGGEGRADELITKFEEMRNAENR